MIILVFKRGAAENFPELASGDVLVHAHPASKPLMDVAADEYSLDGYGPSSGALPKITVSDIVSIMSAHKRIEVL
jgi:hypothetical protein